MSFVPAHRVEGAGDRVAYVLHGIFGSLRNWRGMAAQLAARHPGWRFVLVDLRNHGDSHGAPPPHTLRACADDLARLPFSPEVVVGHSFGGKVALAYARAHGVARTWVLDAVPGLAAPVAGEVEGVLAALRAIPLPVARRDDVARALAPYGPAIAQWMTTNLRPEGDGYVWRFDLDAIEEMLADYAREDFTPWLRATSASVDLVRGARSDRWTPETLAELEGLGPNVRVHVLPDAGHWVHVDNPTGLLALLDDAFRL
ncbi:MAG: alpha/beta fold hydrolase [Myxococcota bacterium]